MSDILLSALINGAVTSAVLALAVSIALRMTPRNSLNASTQYAIWWAVLLVAVAMPFSYLPSANRPLRIQESASSLPAAPAPPVESGEMTVGTDFGPTSAAPFRSRFSFPIEIPAGSWAPRVFLVWSVVAGLLFIRLLISALLLERRKANATEAPPFLSAHAARSPRPSRVAVSSEISVPLASGPRRPTILIPAKLLGELTEPELEQIVIHEAAHFARRDDYALLLQRAIQALFALHPVIAFVCARIDLEREIACDDFVVAATGDSLPYASCLARVVQLSGGVRALPLAAAAAEDRSHLSRRVDMLLDTTRRAGTKLLKLRLAAAAICILGFAWGAEETPRVLAFSTLTPPPAPTVAAPPAETPARPMPLPDIGIAPIVPRARLLAQAAAPSAPAPPAATPAFEVVSIRPNPLPAGQFAFRTYTKVPSIHVAGNRLSNDRATLQDLIMQAYNVWDYQISGLPDWAHSPAAELYDVEATYAENVTPSQEQLQSMVRAILADRFHLSLHREMKDLPVYALIIAKRGLKMQGLPGDPRPGGAILALVSLLSGVVDKPIVDKTGLTGSYDFGPMNALNWRELGAAHRADPLSIPDALEAGLEETMGLKLEARKEPLEVLVIDHAEKPSPNQ